MNKVLSHQKNNTAMNTDELGTQPPNK